MKIVHTSSWKNDGEYHSISPLDNAINEAFIKLHEAGEHEWEKLEIVPLPCDARDSHYPNLCYHYEVTLTGKEEACQVKIWHGPGHQSSTRCTVKGPHEIHETIYGSHNQYAEWKGDDVHSGFFDEPPRIEED